MSWKSSTQKVISQGSIESEYRSLDLATIKLAKLQYPLMDLHIFMSTILVMLTNSVSAKDLTHNPMFHACTKHIEMDHHFIRDFVY